MVRLIAWLFCMYRVWRIWHDRDLLFSERKTFMDNLRPRVDGGCIAYPDAFLMITRRDVDMAENAIEKNWRLDIGCDQFIRKP